MSLPNGFQNVVNRQPGVGQAGDFADANIRANVLYGAGGLVTLGAPRAAVVGNFAWGDQATGYAFGQYHGEATAKPGFVHREQQGLITNFLDVAVESIQAGQMVTLYDQGSFWGLFAAGAAVGNKVFANYADGSLYAAAAGTSTQKATSSATSLANTGVITVGGSLTGTFAVGQLVTGAGGFNAYITAQLSGTVGGAGTYQTAQTGVTIGSEAVTAQDSVETGFSVDSPASAGELAKFSTWG